MRVPPEPSIRPLSNRKGMYFLHGFLVSLVNSVCITAVHVILYPSYMATHPEMAQ